jgi:hypothetical protein
MIKVTTGTVIHATLRTEDLIPAFTEELKMLDEKNQYKELIDDCEHFRDYEPEEQDEMLNESLFDALNSFAPEYCYFGAHQGDGSDFGFWISESLDEDFEGEKVSDLSEVSDDYVGNVLHINDHGNMTLYYKCPYDFHEIWAIV